MQRTRGVQIGKLHEIRISPMANGSVKATTTMKFARGGTGGGANHDLVDSETKHSTAESLHAHIDKHVFAHEPKTGHVDKEEAE